MSRLTWTDPASLKGEATVHEIGGETPGVAWAKLDGRPAPSAPPMPPSTNCPPACLTGWLGTSPHETGKRSGHDYRI
jgi:hypothetical protein